MSNGPNRPTSPGGGSHVMPSTPRGAGGQGKLSLAPQASPASLSNQQQSMSGNGQVPASPASLKHN